jgi:type II secretory pathway pseudopilin PulG
MSQPTWTDIYGLYVNIAIAIATTAAVISALCISNKQIKASSAQLKEQIEESRRLATEERQHQSCPIIVPTKAIPDTILESEKTYHLYTSEANPQLKGNIQWLLPISSLPIDLTNLGGGPAFNVHCVLYGGAGNADAYINQFISWNNGPIGHERTETILFRHPFQDELWLDRKDSIDGIHTLQYPFGGPNPNKAQACLTTTYHDLFGNKLVSIFDYTPDHRWLCVFVNTPSSPKIALDLKELNDQKKQQAVKLSVPPVRTSQGE